MRRIGLVYDKRFLEHRTSLHHLESPRRLTAIHDMLGSSGLAKTCVRVPARYASIDDLCAVHTENHIENILDTAGEKLRYLDADTVTSEQSCLAAFLSAGGCIEAVDTVMAGDLDAVFACVRPPGHHAERNRHMGFCLFNNVAVAARYALNRHGLNRVLVVDWDVHHPNGTQHIFEDTPETLLFSVHRYPFFPGTGAREETGSGSGRGFTINVPLRARAIDADYARIFSTLLAPLARVYNPELVLVSAGFDAHRDDPIGGMLLSADCFAYMTDSIMRIADECCGGRAVFVLEGGYDMGALRQSVRKVLTTMQTRLPLNLRERLEADAHEGCPCADEIDAAQAIVANYWKGL